MQEKGYVYRKPRELYSVFFFFWFALVNEIMKFYFIMTISTLCVGEIGEQLVKYGMLVCKVISRLDKSACPE